MDPLFIALTAGVLMYLLFKIRNKYSRRYNHRLLRNSNWGQCNEVLGAECLELVQSNLEQEIEELKREAKLGTVKLLNMELICTNCERDLYQE